MDRQGSSVSASQQQSADLIKDIQQRGASKENQRTRIESLRSRGAR